MGCDIHAMIEAKRRYAYGNMWSWHGCGRLYLSRDYRLFAKLAGVRNYDTVKPIAPPRLDAVNFAAEFDDETTSQDFWLWARDYGVDGHSHTFVSLDELRTADADLAARCRLIVMAHGFKPEEARLVFFFDN